MKFIINYIVILELLFSLISCKRDGNDSNVVGPKLDIEKTEQQIRKNELKYIDIIKIWKEEAAGQFIVTKKIDDFRFTAVYKPYSVLALEELQNLNSNEMVNKQLSDKMISYSNMHFLNFKIQNESFENELIKFEVEDNQQYYDRITYYSFAAKNEAYVIEDKDTLKCDFVNFERTFEANPAVMLSFGFTRKSKSNNYKVLKFVFEDKIFNKGKLIFNFDTQPILLLNYLKPLS